MHSCIKCSDLKSFSARTPILYYKLLILVSRDNGIPLFEVGIFNHDILRKIATSTAQRACFDRNSTTMVLAFAILFVEG